MITKKRTYLRIKVKISSSFIIWSLFDWCHSWCSCNPHSLFFMISPIPIISENNQSSVWVFYTICCFLLQENSSLTVWLLFSNRVIVKKIVLTMMSDLKCIRWLYFFAFFTKEYSKPYLFNTFKIENAFLQSLIFKKSRFFGLLTCTVSSYDKYNKKPFLRWASMDSLDRMEQMFKNLR